MNIYRIILKPVLFLFEPELVHNITTHVAELLGNYSFTQNIIKKFFSYENIKLEKEVAGLHFKNPIGLSAGFDYNGRMVKILPSIGFGFSTVGTVTNQPYEGNPKPRLVRLPKSQSILVNKGLKSDGAEKIAKHLNDPRLKNIMFGVSVGSSNIPSVNTIDKAINDYLECFSKLEKSPYIKYYELNTSCPNAAMTESFTSLENFEKLLIAVKKLQIKKPIFIKMPNDIEIEQIDKLVDCAMQNNYKNFIFSNLVKSRSNTHLHSKELEKVKNLKGNFSGKPTQERSIELIKRYRTKYKSSINIIGVGGIFTSKDLQTKLDAGADLVQLITGLIYEGPALIKRLNKFICMQ
jgi:dihydroorotate dehydrogenase